MTDTDPVAGDPVGLGWPATNTPTSSTDDVSRETPARTDAVGLGWPTHSPWPMTNGDRRQP